MPSDKGSDLCELYDLRALVYFHEDTQAFPSLGYRYANNRSSYQFMYCPA